MMTEFLDVLANDPILLQGADGGFPARGLAALGVGLASIGAGIAERGIGAAAVGAVAEDSISFGIALVFTVVPETMVILALVTIFLMGG